MAGKEARARIKINKLLEEAGWRFFDSPEGRANILLESNVKITPVVLDGLGENFGGAKNGFVDFLLLDAGGFPFIVLEAKAEGRNPLIGKEQARRYARAQGCRFVLLSNGDDMEGIQGVIFPQLGLQNIQNYDINNAVKI